MTDENQNKPGGDPVPGKKDIANQAAAWALASNFALGTLGMGIVGYAIQRWLWPASAPWPVLIGLGVGLIGGSVQFVREAMAMNRS